MKKLVKTTLIATVLATSANMVLASGIPTVDQAGIATTISENMKTLEKLKEQIETLNTQIEQAKQFAEDTKNRLEGNWKLSDLINNDQFLNALPKNAKDILTNGIDLAGLRDKYGLKTKDLDLQREFDYLMAYADRAERNYKNTVKRIRNLNQIKVLNDSAITPAQKADVANKLALLQLEFNQEQTALKQAEDQFKAQQEMEKKARREKFAQEIKEGAERFHSKFSK